VRRPKPFPWLEHIYNASRAVKMSHETAQDLVYLQGTRGGAARDALAR